MIVEPPWAIVPARTFASAARATAIGSIPGNARRVHPLRTGSGGREPLEEDDAVPVRDRQRREPRRIEKAVRQRAEAEPRQERDERDEDCDGDGSFVAHC
ncbi:MAG: hypothetical protein LC732_03815 [Acidobacteria bacterium]|nr:hypothetical protein [Acidobacteriota bacterium]